MQSKDVNYLQLNSRGDYELMNKLQAQARRGSSLDKDLHSSMLPSPSGTTDFTIRHKSELDNIMRSSLANWAHKNPREWTKTDVLDWLYNVVNEQQLDGSKFRGEGFSDFVGGDLCKMDIGQFQKVDPYYGAKIYDTFQVVLNQASLQIPKSGIDNVFMENFLNVSNVNVDNVYRINNGPALLSGGQLVVGTSDNNESAKQTTGLRDICSETEIQVNLSGLGVYDISREIELPHPSAQDSIRSFLFPSHQQELSPVGTLFDHHSSKYPQSSEISFQSLGKSSHSHTFLNEQSLPEMRIEKLLSKFDMQMSPSAFPMQSSSTAFQIQQSLQTFQEQQSLPLFQMQSSSPAFQIEKSSQSSLIQSPSSAKSDYISSATVSFSQSLPSSLQELLSSSPPDLSPFRRTLDMSDAGYSSEDSTLDMSFMPPVEAHHGDTFINDLTNSGINKTRTIGFSKSSGNENSRNVDKKIKHKGAKNGNLLWMFILSLLRGYNTNPQLLRWEDKDLGVFRIVQSEKVAQLWGAKKNNPGMTYEKLSRAMRFCRKAGYFESVPKTGRFPKKLCFMFGGKAQGWRD